MNVITATIYSVRPIKYIACMQPALQTTIFLASESPTSAILSHL